MVHGARLSLPESVFLRPSKCQGSIGASWPVGNEDAGLYQPPRAPSDSVGFGGWECSCLASGVDATPDFQERESQESPVYPDEFGPSCTCCMMVVGTLYPLTS